MGARRARAEGMDSGQIVAKVAEAVGMESRPLGRIMFLFK